MNHRIIKPPWAYVTKNVLGLGLIRMVGGGGLIRKWGLIRGLTVYASAMGNKCLRESLTENKLI